MKKLIFTIAAFSVFACATTGDKTIINDTIGKNMESINQCYIAEVTKDSSIQGKVEFTITIAGDGSVIKSEILSNTFKTTAVAECVQNIIKTIKFPENSQKKTVTATVPLEFKVETSTEKQDK